MSHNVSIKKSYIIRSSVELLALLKLLKSHKISKSFSYSSIDKRIKSDVITTIILQKKIDYEEIFRSQGFLKVNDLYYYNIDDKISLVIELVTTIPEVYIEDDDDVTFIFEAYYVYSDYSTTELLKSLLDKTIMLEEELRHTLLLVEKLKLLRKDTRFYYHNKRLESESIEIVVNKGVNYDLVLQKLGYKKSEIIVESEEMGLISSEVKYRKLVRKYGNALLYIVISPYVEEKQVILFVKYVIKSKE